MATATEPSSIDAKIVGSLTTMAGGNHLIDVNLNS